MQEKFILNSNWRLQSVLLLEWKVSTQQLAMTSRRLWQTAHRQSKLGAVTHSNATRSSTPSTWAARRRQFRDSLTRCSSKLLAQEYRYILNESNNTMEGLGQLRFAELGHSADNYSKRTCVWMDGSWASYMMPVHLPTRVCDGFRSSDVQ